jgi:hypothetical protein
MSAARAAGFARSALLTLQVEETSMIDVKQAVKIAYDYLTSLYPEARSVELEEVELTEDERYWLITLGYTALGGSIPSAFALREKKYKTLKTDAESGRVVSMKMRLLK